MSKNIWVLFAAIAVSVVILAYILQYIHEGTMKPDLLVGVCVLSARNNREQRDTIRSTWFTAAGGSSTEDDKTDRTHVKFVVGTEACQVHPEDRVDQYGCGGWKPDIQSDFMKDFEAFAAETPSVTGPVANMLSLTILHPATLKRIGILENITLSEEPLVVSAFKEFDEEDLCSVSFSRKDPGILHKGFRYQPIDPILLPKVGPLPYFPVPAREYDRRQVQ